VAFARNIGVFQKAFGEKGMIGILTDITKCVGCEKCIHACQTVNKCEPEQPEQKALPGELFDTRWTTVVRRTGAASPRFVRKHCMHCLNPACVAVCPVGALQKTSQGPVIYDKKRCIGCRYCMLACPFGIPRSEWEKLAPAIRKCTFCFERTHAGGKPACTEACPEAATIFGSRDDLLREARKRILDSPGRYMNKIYGETELGGTCVLYVSDINLDFLSFDKAAGDRPPPELSWRFLRKTPVISGAAALSISLLYWLWKRRSLVAEERKQRKS
jgi:formate dehydrogenase iron-sulfur subunit